MDRHFLALDISAESGRAILAKIADNRIDLKEIHRFPNAPVELPTGVYWDALRLFDEICVSLCAATANGAEVDSLAINAWAADFALLSAEGELLQNPLHYRDPRVEGIPQQIFATLTPEELFKETGIAPSNDSSLYQLYLLRQRAPGLLEHASKLLFMPDLFNYFLTGTFTSERTIASSSQLYNAKHGRFATDMLRKLGISAGFFSSLVNPGVELGPVLPHVAERCRLKNEPVVFATGSHETASAVAAVPASLRDHWCYISSGPWSSMGIELPEPIINDTAFEAGFSNEAGVAGKIRLSKNIPALLLLEGCRRGWAQRGHTNSYAQLIAEAAVAENDTILNLDEFNPHADLPAQIADQCRRTDQQLCDDPGSTTRVLLQSVAARYAEVLEEIETLTEKNIDMIHVIGPGSQIDLLNQMLADVTGRRVMSGPMEATVLGNVLTQAMGFGDIGTIEEMRAIIRSTCELEEFTPTT